MIYHGIQSEKQIIQKNAHIQVKNRGCGLPQVVPGYLQTPKPRKMKVSNPQKVLVITLEPQKLKVVGSHGTVHQKLNGTLPTDP